MNDTIIKAITATIARLSCDKCDRYENAHNYQDREEQCRIYFSTDAEAIYTAHVKPLEDALIKAEARAALDSVEEKVCLVKRN